MTLCLLLHLFHPMADDPTWLVLLRWALVTGCLLILGLGVAVGDHLLSETWSLWRSGWRFITLTRTPAGARRVSVREPRTRATRSSTRSESSDFGSGSGSSSDFSAVTGGLDAGAVLA